LAGKFASLDPRAGRWPVRLGAQSAGGGTTGVSAGRESVSGLVVVTVAGGVLVKMVVDTVVCHDTRQDDLQNLRSRKRLVMRAGFGGESLQRRRDCDPAPSHTLVTVDRPINEDDLVLPVAV